MRGGRVARVPESTTLAVDDVLRRAALSVAKGGEIDDLADREFTLRMLGVERDDSVSIGFVTTFRPRRISKEQRFEWTICRVCGTPTRWSSWFRGGKPPQRCPQHPAQRHVFRWKPM